MVKNQLMPALIGYFIRIGDAFSQLINVAFLWSKNPNESVSGRAYRLQGESKLWAGARVLIDWLARPFEKNHCMKAYLKDVARAKKLLGIE